MFAVKLCRCAVRNRGKFEPALISAAFSSKSDIIVRPPTPDVDIPNVLLQEYLLEGLDKWSDKIAAECCETNRKYTYAEIYKKSRALASFIQKYGLGKGDIIAIILPNVPEFFIALLGIMQSGATITTVNPIYTPDEIKRQLTSSGVSLIITLNDMFPNVKKATEGITQPPPGIITIKQTQTQLSHVGSINFDEACSTNYEFRAPEATPNDVVLLPYSSGTTGLPKGVQLTHRNLVANYVQTSVDEFKLNTDTKGGNQDVVPIVVPMYHLYGLGVVGFTMFARGVKFITMPKFNMDNMAAILHKYNTGLLYVVPPIVLAMLNNACLKIEQVNSIRTIVSAAAPLGGTDINRFNDKTCGKINLLQIYGMTEAAPVTHHQSFILNKGIKIGGSGFMLPNMLCKIVDVNDPDCKGLGPNQSGELLCKGPQVMKGYFNNEEANKQIFAGDGWLRTGDIAHYDEDQHFFITDRIKELIKVKGYQVPPAELEEVLRDHVDIEDAAVIGVRHHKSGEVPKAYIVLKDGSKLTADDIHKYMEEKVVKYKQLTGGIEFIKSIPKTASGKILRKDLKV